MSNRYYIEGKEVSSKEFEAFKKKLKMIEDGVFGEGPNARSFECSAIDKLNKKYRYKTETFGNDSASNIWSPKQD